MIKFLLYPLLFYNLINPICSIVLLKSISSSFPDSPARFSSHNTTKLSDILFYFFRFSVNKLIIFSSNIMLPFAASGLNGSSICGILRLADPLNACSSLLNEVEYGDSGSVTIVLIERGKCAFDEKIRNAQEAGFDAAIVYDDQPNSNLISMMGNPDEIQIHSVFVSNVAGEILREYAQVMGSECCIVSFLDETIWTVLVTSCVSVLAVMFLLAAILFLYNHVQNHQETRSVIDGKAVDDLPCVKFGSLNLMSPLGDTCAICLEDYNHGEDLKLLPCHHDFHASCVNSWLTKWSTFCPVCKHDIRNKVASLAK